MSQWQRIGRQIGYVLGGNGPFAAVFTCHAGSVGTGFKPLLNLFPTWEEAEQYIWESGNSFGCKYCVFDRRPVQGKEFASHRVIDLQTFTPTGAQASTIAVSAALHRAFYADDLDAAQDHIDHAVHGLRQAARSTNAR